MKLFEQNHVKYGLLMSGLLALCLGALYATGTSFEDKASWQMAFTVLVPLVVWYFGIKAKKETLKNKMTFKQGLREGFKISLVFAIVSPFVFVFFYLVNPALLDYVKEMYRMTNTSTLMVIMVDMVAQFFSAIVFGTIYGGIISFFLKTKTKK